MSEFRMADRREVVVDVPVDGARYNVYGCPGAAENATRIERTANGPIVHPGTVAHWLLSMDVDDGVTPFMVTCPDHGLAAESRMYPRGLTGDPSLWPVRMVWRKATNGEMKRERREGGDHYRRGGLAREWVPIP